MHSKVLRLFIFLSLSCLCLYRTAQAEVFYAQDEAMQIAFADADSVERETFILSNLQHQRIEKKARAKISSKLVTAHIGIKDGEIMGYAFIESRLVRTATATFMCVFSPDGVLESTIILAFNEPPDYLLSDKWLEQFEGKDLSSPLRPGNDIHGVVGSTLSVNAISKGVRAAIAYYDILIAEG